VVVRASGLIDDGAPETSVRPVGGRLGIVASKRVGNAVARNRGKRLVREWFRQLVVPPSGDVVVILRVGAPTLNARDAWPELDHGLREAHRRAARSPGGGRRRRAPAPQTSAPDGGDATLKG